MEYFALLNLTMLIIYSSNVIRDGKAMNTDDLHEDDFARDNIRRGAEGVSCFVDDMDPADRRSNVVILPVSLTFKLVQRVSSIPHEKVVREV